MIGRIDMESDSESRLFDIFLTSASMEDAQARAAYLKQACADDEALRRQVEMLLAAETRAGGPPSEFSAPTGHDPTLSGRLGCYELLEQIGEGGFATVYKAEQTEPVRRTVALKIVKLGMDTKQVLARFEAERQALAMMDHPSIARVFDAGFTDSGRPYFVMELVRGIAITDYCDQNQCSIRERLGLFMQVCHAVQHGHQKGIIHRDLKPSNLLVTEVDGKPLPKIIDFGIAKAVQGRLTDHTLITSFEHVLGTPAYMSPEQASMATADIDTRADIYSLGVILYQLLTGQTPFSRKELLETGIEAMRRTITERVPESPSKRLTAMSPRRVESISKARRIDPSRFRHWLKGELDWIVMKCLEKDRQRRYETADALAMDLQHYLKHEPLAARPPSRLYEFRKTARRHWIGFAATGMIMIVLAVGATVSTWQALRAAKAEREQVQLRMDAEAALRALQRDAETQAAQAGNFSNLLMDLDRSVGRWPYQPQLWTVRASLLEQIGRYDDAIDATTRVIELLDADPNNSDAYLNESLLTRCRLLIMQGRMREAGLDNCRVRGIPPRSQESPQTALDLSPFYDAPLTESLHGDRGTAKNNLAELKPGVLRWEGHSFDVRGILSLDGATLVNNRYDYPQQVSGIPAGMRFHRLHSIILTGWDNTDGTQIGSFVLHYEDGTSAELPILYGVHVRDMVAHPFLDDGGDAPLPSGRVVWKGMNELARDFGGYARIYMATWENPRPGQVVRSLDFNSSMTRCALSTLAITVEP